MCTHGPTLIPDDHWDNPRARWGVTGSSAFGGVRRRGGWGVLATSAAFGGLPDARVPYPPRRRIPPASCCLTRLLPAAPRYHGSANPW